jgi:hypothetical protein
MLARKSAKNHVLLFTPWHPAYSVFQKAYTVLCPASLNLRTPQFFLEKLSLNAKNAPDFEKKVKMTRFFCQDYLEVLLFSPTTI